MTDPNPFAGFDPRNTGVTAPSGGGGLGDMLADKLLALCPLGIDMLETEGYGARQATVCQVLNILAPESDKAYADLGEVLIPWDQPRAELQRATPDAPWVVGRLVKRTKAWFLNPASPREVLTAQRAISEWAADPAADGEGF